MFLDVDPAGSWFGVEKVFKLIEKRHQKEIRQ